MYMSRIFVLTEAGVARSSGNSRISVSCGRESDSRKFGSAGRPPRVVGSWLRAQGCPDGASGESTRYDSS